MKYCVVDKRSTLNNGKPIYTAILAKRVKKGETTDEIVTIQSRFPIQVPDIDGDVSLMLTAPKGKPGRG